MNLYPTLVHRQVVPSHVFRAEFQKCVTWNHIFPADSGPRYHNSVRTMLELGFSSVMDPDSENQELLRQAGIRQVIYGHSRCDMIVGRVSFRAIDIIGNYIVVITGRDDMNRNQYGLFHRQLDERGVEF